MTNHMDARPEGWDPKDWLDVDEPATTHAPDAPWSHRGDTSVHDEVVANRDRRDAHHHIVSSLADLRRVAGRTQHDVASHWGRPQPKVSRLERQPDRAEVATLASYVAALDGRLTVEVEVDGETYRYELI